MNIFWPPAVRNSRRVFQTALLASAALCSYAGHAVTVPNSAEIGRLGKIPPEFARQADDQTIDLTPPARKVDIPKGAESVKLILRSVKFEGVTAFSEASLKELYAAYQDQEVNLGVAWIIAGALTERYHANGYFLSRAFVPKQAIENGVITIRAVEGHIAKIDLQDPIADHWIIKQLTSDILKKKPIKTKEIESFLLKMNDFPGISFRAVMSALKDPDASSIGGIKLELVPQKDTSTITVSANNFGSRFLGPYETSAEYRTSVLPLQQTMVSGMSTVPVDELSYFSFSHSLPVWSGVTLEMGGTRVLSYPGDTLRRFEIKGQSNNLSLGVIFRAIRQREENLSVKVGLDGKNAKSDILATVLSDDRIRAIRTSATYDMMDRYRGYNFASLTLSQGIEVLGSSRKGDLNLSRGEAAPDFRKAEILVSRLQDLGSNFTLTSSLSGQFASGPLYSGEEFGYGGQNFGRAYDNAEIAGDHGIAASLEFRYTGVDLHPAIAPVPYAFYDIGKIWNDDAGQVKQASAASAGFGLRVTTNIGLSGNLGVAFPLTKDADNPIYGKDGSNPRYLVSMSYQY
jgi:hemolysin activation/secretion protein